jgi:hypothetical protein
LEEKEALHEVSGQTEDLLQNSMVWSLLEEKDGEVAFRKW